MPFTRTRPPTIYIKTLTRSKHQGSKKSANKSKHQKRKNRTCEIASSHSKSDEYKCQTHQRLPNRKNVAWLDKLLVSMAATLIRRDNRVASGSRRFERQLTPGFLILLYQEQRLTVATSMTFQQRRYALPLAARAAAADANSSNFLPTRSVAAERDWTNGGET